MKPYSFFLNLARILSIGCLFIGYIAKGSWLIVPVLLILAITWVLPEKYSTFWLTSSLLLIYIFLAAIGVMIKLSPVLMTFGCIAALVCWDLTCFQQSLAENVSYENNVSLERYHLQSLAVAIFGSLFLVLISSLIDLQLPFGLTLILVVAVVGGLVYGLKYVMK